MPLPALLVSVFKDLLWAFLAKPILMRAVWALLDWAVQQTDNDLDNDIVEQAKARYYTRDGDPLDSGL